MVSFGAFSLARMVEIENGLLRCDQHLELQVLSTHMPYIEEIFFRTSNRARPDFKVKSRHRKRYRNSILIFSGGS